MDFSPLSEDDIEKMLNRIGVVNIDELFLDFHTSNEAKCSVTNLTYIYFNIGTIGIFNARLFV